MEERFTTMAREGPKATGKGSAARKSFRIEVKLFEPDADSFPEYNFRQLLVAEKKKHKERQKVRANGGLPLGPGGLPSDDPLAVPGDEEDDDVARLAREMEEKYGSGSAYSKCNKRGTVDEFDKGVGYDENDSFIDNTDAYDEIIPDEIEPNHGGFYINSGLLEFSNRPNFERPEDAERMPKARKRTLSTSSSESSSDDDEVNDGKDNQTGDTAKAAAKKSSSSSQEKKMMKKKRKKKEMNGTSGKESSEGEVQHKNNNHIKVNHGEKKLKVTDKEEGKAVPSIKVASVPSKKQNEEGPNSAAIKTTTVKEMLRLKRDNHRNKHDPFSSSGSSSDDDDDEDESDKSVDSGGEKQQPQPQQHKPEPSTKATTNNGNSLPTLPEQVSKELMHNLILLEQSAQVLSGPGESVLTNPAALDCLLSIEQQTIAEGGGGSENNKKFRQQVYAYLESRLKCTPGELMAKGERMRVQSEEAKLRKLVAKLKKTVESRMAKLLETYESESRRVAEMKSQMHVIGFVSESHAQVQMPRRRFHWTDSSRKLLYEVYLLARANYVTQQEGKKKSGVAGGSVKSRTVEEYLAEFLKQEVLPLWPTGWMKYDELVKEVEKRRLAVQKQNAVQDMVNSSAWMACVEGKEVGGGAVGSEVNGVIKTTVTVPKEASVESKKNGGGGGGGAEEESKSNSDQSSLLVKQKQQQQNHNQQPKKNSYDYSITNLIGNSQQSAAAVPMGSAGGGSSGGEGKVITGTVKQNASNLKIKSFASVVPTPTATVILSCDDDDDDEMDGRQQQQAKVKATGTVVDLHRGKVQVATSAVITATAATTAAAVRSKRTSDSDSSCEIVNVYNSAGNVKAVKPLQMKMKNGVHGEDSTSLLKMGRPAGESSTSQGGGGGTPMDTNDIDVNQIMADLKEWQEWETGSFNAKKTEFTESRRDVLMLKKAKIMDHLTSLAAATHSTNSTAQQHQHHQNHSGLK